MNTHTDHEIRGLIVIIGFMGSGKTTVARELGRLLRCRAIDLDELISERERRSPGEIIEQSGEDEFRRIETETLRQSLAEQSDSPAGVIALGGGTWTLPENRVLIDQHDGLTVWLDTPFELCWQRIETGGERRPLAGDEPQARMLHALRQPQYALARVQLQVGTNQSAAEICVKIVEALRTRNN
jgi:shikimate kinase